MARRRDVRRFGRGPYVLGTRREPGKWGDGFPDERDDGGLAPCAYDDLEAVRVARGFLDAPDRFIRAALEK